MKNGFQQLERWADGELSALPELQTPADLEQKLRLAIASGQPVRTPLSPGARLVLMVMSISPVVISAAVLAAGWFAVLRYADSILLAGTRVWEFGSSMGRALLIVLRSVDPVWWLYAGSAVAAAYLCCLALGAACLRVALSRR